MSTKIDIKGSAFKGNTQIGNNNRIGKDNSEPLQTNADAEITVNDAKFKGDIQIGNDNVMSIPTEAKRALEAIKTEVRESSSISSEQKKT